MDSSNSFRVYDLLTSNDAEDRQLGKEAVRQFDELVKKLKPVLKHCVAPSRITRYGHNSGECMIRAACILSINSSPHVVGNDQALLIDEKGRFTIGRQCCNCPGGVHYVDTQPFNWLDRPRYTWELFPYTDVVQGLLTFFRRAESIREGHLKEIKERRLLIEKLQGNIR